MKDIITKIIEFIKKYKNWFIISAFALLIVLCAGMCQSNRTLKEERNQLKENEKALMLEIEGAGNEAREMQMSIETLEQFSDSISTKLLQAKNDLKIKDKEVRDLQYMMSTFSRIDTVVLTDYDTVFKDPDFRLDTVLGDPKWLSVKLCMRYPNMISTDVSAKSEKEVIIHSKKETINPPKKFFLFRWFQKKQTVTIVDVNEENPYIVSQQNRFIKVSD